MQLIIHFLISRLTVSYTIGDQLGSENVLHVWRGSQRSHRVQGAEWVRGRSGSATLAVFRGMVRTLSRPKSDQPLRLRRLQGIAQSRHQGPRSRRLHGK